MKELVFVLLSIISIHIYSQEQLPIGSFAPTFEATDQNGKRYSLDESLKEGPVIIIFYRGQWCQYCNIQMANLSDSMSMITKMGASIVAITPESNEYIKVTEEKTNVSFSIIYDEGHKIMDSFKVTFDLGRGTNFFYKISGININEASGNNDRALPVPATYIIDRNRKIIGAHFEDDHTKRMHVIEMIDVLKKI